MQIGERLKAILEAKQMSQGPRREGNSTLALLRQSASKTSTGPKHRNVEKLIPRFGNHFSSCSQKTARQEPLPRAQKFRQSKTWPVATNTLGAFGGGSVRMCLGHRPS